VEAHLNRGRRDAQGFGGLLNVAVFKFAENEDFTIGKGEGDEGTAD
jgi:hypothetical protein